MSALKCKYLLQKAHTTLNTDAANAHDLHSIGAIHATVITNMHGTQCDTVLFYVYFSYDL